MKIYETYVSKKLLTQVLELVSANPERNIPHFLSIFQRITTDPDQRRALAWIEEKMKGPNNNWYQWLVRLLTQTHPRMRRRLTNNFLINAIITGLPKQRRMENSLGTGVPWALLIDPTEKCNLKCTGCWAGDYQRVNELEYEVLDRVISEAKDLGIYFIVYSGGEPTVRKEDIFSLAEKHRDMAFMMFTNGTLIDAAFVDELVRLGNITVVFSLEGFQQKTDARRGPGVFAKVMQSMDLLREAGLIFGASVTYTRQTTEELGSDEFIDMLVDKGVAFAWCFTYIPIGKDVDLAMMATPEQRAWMRQRLQEIRRTKPLLLIDFWNDGELCDGCIAAGRRYFHINANGDVEPCAFVHYSTCNIKNVILRRALANPLFRAYQKRQPFNRNLLRPCPLIDNPAMMKEIVDESGAHWTQQHAGETAAEFAERLQPYAAQWGNLADKIWDQEHMENSTNKVVDELDKVL